MDPRRRAISLAGLSGLSVGFALPAFGQDVQERTIRFGHLNNADHPVSFEISLTDRSSISSSVITSRAAGESSSNIRSINFRAASVRSSVTSSNRRR